MKMQTSLLALALVAGLTGAIAATVHATELQGAPAPKTSLVDAVGAAERHVNGRAVRAEYERHRGVWSYDVEVLSDQGTFDVRVAADSGTVIASARDTMDHDDHDEED